jgi:hypothetical protein
VDSLEHARESFARHDWLDAFAALSGADAEQPQFFVFSGDVAQLVRAADS